MGVESVFLVASPNEALRIASTYDHSEWPNVYAKGQSEDSLAFLWHCLDESIDCELSVDFFVELTGNGQDGPWVTRVPDELVELLKNVPVTNENSLFEAWTKYDDWDSCDDEDFRCMREEFDGLLNLCRTHVDEDRHLMMWTSL